MNKLALSGINYLVLENLNAIDIYKASPDRAEIKDQILTYILAAINNLPRLYKAGLIAVIMTSRILISLGAGSFIFNFFPFTTLNRFVRGYIFLRIFELLPFEVVHQHA